VLGSLEKVELQKEQAVLKDWCLSNSHFVGGAWDGWAPPTQLNTFVLAPSSLDLLLSSTMSQAAPP